MSSIVTPPQPATPPTAAPNGQFTPTISHFAGTLSTPTGGAIATDTTFRRYAAGVQTVSQIGGQADTSNRKIVYEVGRAVPTIKKALAGRPDDVTAVDCSYPTGAILHADFEGYTKKFSNFSASFTITNLAGVVERIASTLAATSVFPSVTTSHMRHGNVYDVVALGTKDSPINASDGSVFIPRLVDSVLAPDTFAVLASAISGEGSQVITDVVALDSNTNKPIIREVSGPALSKACVDALRILGANFSAADVGDLFAYAVTRGIHRVVSVVGHTDEGGIIRSCLRKSSFSAPFGGIHYGLAPYVGLPALASTSPSAIACYVDTIALKTAALVAHCDPGLYLNGSWFPTVISSAASQVEVVPGEAQEGTAEDIAANRLGIMPVFFDFAEQYCSALAKLFLFSSCSGKASQHLQLAPAYLADDERHLKFTSLSPFYWIEPTSLIPRNFVGSVCESEGFASYATVCTPTTLPGFEEIHQYGSGSTSMSGYVLKFRGARASPFLAHWNGNALNGLGCIQVRQMDPNAIVHPGTNADRTEVRARVEAARPLSEYLWTRGQSPFAAPGEFLNISKTIGVMAIHNTVNDEGDMTMSHIPQSYEFLDSKVTFHVSRPTGIKVGDSNAGTTTCARARSRATRELAAAVLRTQMFGRADVIDMPVLTSAPALPSEYRLRQQTPDPQGNLGPNTIKAATTAGVEVAAGDAAHNTLQARTVLHHSPHRGPTVQRASGIIPTSTSAPTLPSTVTGSDETTATPIPGASSDAGNVSPVDPVAGADTQ